MRASECFRASALRLVAFLCAAFRSSLTSPSPRCHSTAATYLRAVPSTAATDLRAVPCSFSHPHVLPRSMQIHAEANDFQSARGSPASRPPCLRPLSVERAADMFQVLHGGERGAPELQAGTGDGVEAEEEQGSECTDGLSSSAAGESGSRDQVMVEGQGESERERETSASPRAFLLSPPTMVE